MIGKLQATTKVNRTVKVTGLTIETAKMVFSDWLVNLRSIGYSTEIDCLTEFEGDRVEKFLRSRQIAYSVEFPGNSA